MLGQASICKVSTIRMDSLLESFTRLAESQTRQYRYTISEIDPYLHAISKRTASNVVQIMNGLMTPLKLKFSLPGVVFVFACILVALIGAMTSISAMTGIVGMPLGTVIQIFVWALVFIMYELVGINYADAPSFLTFSIIIGFTTLVFSLPAFFVFFFGKKYLPHWLTSALILAWFGMFVWAYLSTQIDYFAS